MAASDLTTLSAVKAWLGITTTASDGVLSSLVSSVCRSIYAQMARPAILPASYTEVFDGDGGSRLFLENYPVISVSSLAVNGASFAAAPALSTATTYPGAGWVLDTINPAPPSRPATLHLRGGRFAWGMQNIVVSYSAGYQASGEAQSVPSSGSYQVTAAQPFGAWATDQGVTYASGTALTKVSTPSAAGQYAVSGGVYTFSAADAGASVLLSYGYIPGDLAQAALEWTAFRFKARDNIGFRSKSLGGQETINFDTSTVPAVVRDLVQPYRRVFL